MRKQTTTNEKPKSTNKKDDFLSNYRSFLAYRSRALNQDIHRDRERLGELTTDIVQIYESLLRYEQELSSENENIDLKMKHINQQYEAIQRYSALKDFYFTNDKLVLEFKPLKMDYDYTRVTNRENNDEIREQGTLDLPEYTATLDLVRGEFQFKCNPNSEYNKHFFSSLTRTDQYRTEGRIVWIHPHIFSDGRPCLGNVQSIFLQILAKGDYAQIIDLIHQYLITYNSASPTIKIHLLREYWRHNQ